MGPYYLPARIQQGRYKSFTEFFLELKSPYKSLFGSFSPTYEDYRDILQWMRDGVLYAGSDGSVEEKIGAHAFSFTNGNKRSCI